MVGIAEIGGAAGAIKTALDMAKGMQSLKTEAAINQAVIDIQRALLDAQSAAVDDKARHMELLTEISALKEQLTKISNWETEKKKYQMTEFSEGRFAYVFVGDDNSPSHKLCAHCFAQERKSILQTVNKHSGGESVYCQSCDKKTTLSEFPKVEIDYGGSRRSRYDGF